MKIVPLIEVEKAYFLFFYIMLSFETPLCMLKTNVIFHLLYVII